MKNYLDSEQRLAQRRSFVGAVILYVVAALSALPVALLLLSLSRGRGLGTVAELAVAALLVLSQTASSAAIALLGDFLRHFSRDADPFGRAQPARLVATAGLLLLHTLTDAAAAALPATARSVAGPLASALELDLKPLVLTVFLACLAMVVRYGNALKEDSDGFV